MRGVGNVRIGHGMRQVERLQGTVLGVRRNGIRQFPREVIEAALAHVVQNKVEAAYVRSDLFERRRG